MMKISITLKVILWLLIQNVMLKIIDPCFSEEFVIAQNCN